MDDSFKRNRYPKNQTPPMYVELETKLKPIAKDIAFRWSSNHVPHLLVELGKGIVYSLCYFKKRESWKVFFPYEKYPFRREEFSSIEDMVKFLRRHKPIKGIA